MPQNKMHMTLDRRGTGCESGRVVMRWPGSLRGKQKKYEHTNNSLLYRGDDVLALQGRTSAPTGSPRYKSGFLKQSPWPTGLSFTKIHSTRCACNGRCLNSKPSSPCGSGYCPNVVGTKAEHSHGRMKIGNCSPLPAASSCHRLLPTNASDYSRKSSTSAFPMDCSRFCGGMTSRANI